jgi:DNA-binding response OmpR family regulator
MIENLALIIDDDPTVTELLTLAVETTLGCKVITAINGEIGLYEARKQKPDFILLDWIMPEMSGLQVLDELAENEETVNIPVYMITRKATVEDARRARASGAVGYYMKPLQFDHLCSWLAEKFPDLAETR